jgi:hypothetical protein
VVFLFCPVNHLFALLALCFQVFIWTTGVLPQSRVFIGGELQTVIASQIGPWMNRLWITFSRKFSSMISTLNQANHEKA